MGRDRGCHRVELAVILKMETVDVIHTWVGRGGGSEHQVAKYGLLSPRSSFRPARIQAAIRVQHCDLCM